MSRNDPTSLPKPTVDMSPEAIALRLEYVDELRRLGLSLMEAGRTLRKTADAIRSAQIPARSASDGRLASDSHTSPGES